MKYPFALVILLAFCAGCAKINYPYAIVCDYYSTPYSASEIWLMVSDDDGNVLNVFDLPVNSSHFTGEFDYESKHPAETYNLHLIRRDSSIYNHSAFIQSCYGVQNGTSVSFNPEFNTISSPYTVHTLFISDLEGLDSLIVPNWFYNVGYSNYGYDPDTHSAKFDFYAESSANLIVRIRPTPSAPFRSLYLPTTTSTTTGLALDSIYISWADFLPDDRFIMVEPANGILADGLEVTAIDSDFKRFTTLLRYDTADHQPASVRHRVALPAGLNPQSLIRVRMRQGNFISERIFQAGEALRMDAPQISIEGGLFSAYRSLKIATRGNPDMVTVLGYPRDRNSGHPSSFIAGWFIKGPPQSFERMILPDLKDILPDLKLASAPDSISWHVNAYKYDQLDYNQILAGFPYKGDDGRLFSIARASLQEVTKNY